MPVYEDRPEPFSQGDIFTDVPFTLPAGDFDRLSRLSLGMIVAHDCDCDKAAGRHEEAPPDQLTVATAPVYPLALFEASGQAGDIRAGRIRRYFHLPEEDGREALCVDLVLHQPMPVPLLRRREKVASLSDEYRGRLLLHMWRMLARDTPLPVPETEPDGT